METTQAQKPKYIRVLREQIECNFDYLEALLGGSIFPRKAMPGFQVGQKIYFKKETLLVDFENADFQDCFIASHGEMDKELAILKVVFLDFDNPNNLVGAIQEALKVAERIKKEYNVVPHVQFSGSKGCHVILPILPIEFETVEDEKRFLFYFQSKLTKESSFADKQVFGDISRLIRVPFTINSKAIDMPWHGYVKVLQEWNGNYANLEKEHQTWKVKRAIEESAAAQKPIVISNGATGKFNDFGLKITDVVDIAKMHKSGDKYYGTHPIHGSTTGRNFWVIPSKNYWHCFRHGIGGGPLHFLAVKYGLVNPEDFAATPEPKKFVLRGEVFRKVLEKAVEEGLLPPEVLKKKRGVEE